jgi:hypothetical protein
LSGKRNRSRQTYIEIFEGLQVGQLGRNALESVEVHLPRQPESDKTAVRTINIPTTSAAIARGLSLEADRVGDY